MVLKKRHRGQANRMPTPPRIQNEARQCSRSATNPLSEPPTATPIIWRVAKTAIARERVSGPWAAAISAYAAGMNMDSETPSSPRHTKRKAPFGENPDRTVKVLQIARLPTTSLVFEKRSPRIPATGEHRPYTHRNSAPVSPTTASL